MKSCYFCNTEYIDQDYDGNSAFPIVKGFKRDYTVRETCSNSIILPIRQLYKKYKIDGRTGKTKTNKTLIQLMLDEDNTNYVEEDDEVYILIDYKLNAIIGTFSDIDNVKKAKALVVKRDIDLIKKKIDEELILSTLDQSRKHYLIGKLNIIDLMYSDYEARWETSFLDFDGMVPLNRYGWYRMIRDKFLLDKSMFGPIVLLPPPKD